MKKDRPHKQDGPETDVATALIPILPVAADRRKPSRSLVARPAPDHPSRSESSDTSRNALADLPIYEEVWWWLAAENHKVPTPAEVRARIRTEEAVRDLVSRVRAGDLVDASERDHAAGWDAPDEDWFRTFEGVR